MQNSHEPMLLDTHAWIWLSNGDPADRLIVASARVEGLTLVTRDKRILGYGKDHHVRTLAC
jgi:PIN domain nuclease of toxin-antitoxin system